MMHPHRVCCRSLLLFLLAATVALASDQTKKTPRSFHIGISDALIRGQTTPAAALVQVQPMAEVFGMVGNVRPQFQFDSAEGLAKSLSEGKIQLAVMPGIEYGWLGEKGKGLAPLALAYTSDIRLKAYVLTNTDNKVTTLRELKGERLALPRRAPYHTQIFLHYSICSCGAQPQGFFARSTLAPDTDAAIECVIDKEAVAVVVDGQSWEVFKERKSGRAKRLRVLAESPAFPTSALVYKPGSMSDEDLKQLKEGLFTAHEKAFTRQLLNFWRISRFVPYTPEYEQVVQSIVHDIPVPIVPATFAGDK
jgi:ABC-type phosphate/phosphonate transport system substrate-binding protein